MAKFTEADLRDILHSDMKLWEQAHVGPVSPEWAKAHQLPEDTVGIIKEIECPLVGGKEVWVFPANEKQYVEQFGPAVRQVVKEIKDEAEELSARNRLQAEVRAQEARESASRGTEDGGSEGGEVAAQPVLSTPVQEAVPSFDDAIAGATDFASRRDALSDGIAAITAQVEELTAKVKRYTKELHAVNAALEIMNAPEDDGAEPTDVPTETQRS